MQFIVKQCKSDRDFAIAAELAAELAAWDIAETQKLGIPADEVSQFYYPADAVQEMLLLASFDAMPAGCVGYRQMSPEACELKRLYVRPMFRGSGLGAILISSLEKKARAAGYSRICLETTPFMKGAVRLYEKAGFGPCESYYAIPEIFADLSIFMEKHVRVS